MGSCAACIPVSATKAQHGYLLNAASALECVLSPMAMHLQQADPQCDLDYVHNAARVGVTVCSTPSRSFASGGMNVLRAIG